jgi:hypothetical protein
VRSSYWPGSHIPHIVPLHDSGGTASLLWYTLPYLDGESLRPRLARLPGSSYLAMAYDAMGRREESRAVSRRTLPILEQHLELYPDDARAWYTGATDLSRLGEREKAL